MVEVFTSKKDEKDNVVVRTELSIGDQFPLNDVDYRQNLEVSFDDGRHDLELVLLAVCTNPTDSC